MKTTTHDRIASEQPQVPAAFMSFNTGTSIKGTDAMKNFIRVEVKPAIDLSGKVFGGLTVIRPIGRQHTKTVYECVCNYCGSILKVTSCNIQRNMACGCQKGGVVTHGQAGSKGRQTIEYKTWARIKRRCFNKNDKSYPEYGAKGITMCARWQKFENFIADMGVRPDDKESIDRKDNSKGYVPGNCRWADRKQQNRNKRNNNFITYHGETHCVGEWAEILGMSAKLITARLFRGVTVDRAFKNINLVTGNPLSGSV